MSTRRPSDHHPDDVAYMRSLQRNLRNRRFDLGLDAQQLSHKIGKSRSYINEAERTNAMMTVTRMHGWAAGLGLYPIISLGPVEKLVRDGNPEIVTLDAMVDACPGNVEYLLKMLRVKIRAAREASNLTTGQLGAKMGVSGESVCNWELSNDSDVNLSYLFTVSRALGGRLSVMFGEAEE